MNNLLIVAHRGASYAAPENTIPSFELALKENADFIEGDFWLTNDNEIVCIHDPNTKRVTGGKNNLNVRRSTLSELKKLDVGIWKGERYKGATIPSLQEVLQIIPKEKGIYIEIKDNREICVIKLVEILKRFSISPDKIRIITFHPNTVQLAKKYLPEIKAYWLFSSYFQKKKCLKYLAQKRLIQTLQTINCDGIDVNAGPYIDMKLVKLFRDSHLDFCAYDVNELDDAIKLINLGVDSITTDFPLKMRKEIEKHLFYLLHSDYKK